MAADRRSPLLLILIVVALSAAASARLPQLRSSSENVNLALHLTHLSEDVEMLSIVDLKLVPYGNAEKSQTGTIICQHGEWECKLNKVEACAINVFPIMNEYFLFIHCVEDLVDKYQYTDWEQYLKELNDPTPIMDCYNGQRGDEINIPWLIHLNALSLRRFPYQW
uniref:Uncharacterized protein n=1 Tax=Kalanchoe fedtschenkoi TaxID=63787 RepID=A0A7N0VKW4_KALFE